MRQAELLFRFSKFSFLTPLSRLGLFVLPVYCNPNAPHLPP